jgi:LPPG:FO 2-phospho-L-lactate transferase
VTSAPPPPQRIVVLAGGYGGARFLRGLQRAAPSAEITAIVNTGDDVTLHGLRICPDLDTIMYTLGGGLDEERGWGRVGETFAVRDELSAYGVGPAWFGLGDRDLATHLVRTQMLDAGYPLSAVTQALCDRWKPGVRLLPMTDDRVETHVTVSEPAGSSGPDGSRRRAIHFQEWWVRYGASLPAEAIVPVGAAEAKPAPGVLEAIAEADVVLLPPSNPVVSVGVVLAVPGIKSALRAASAPLVGVSPIIGGAPVRGMADACLRAIDVPVTAQGVGRLYGARSDDAGGADGTGGLLDAWLVDTGDVDTTVPGVRIVALPLLMPNPAEAAALAEAALEVARAVR